MFTPRNSNDASPNGYGIVYNNYIYAVPKYSGLGHKFKQLATKEERVEFLKTKGEKRPGELMWDTRRTAPDELQN
jgi:hypothetical protein